MIPALCELLSPPIFLSFFSWSVCFINGAPRTAACLAKTASLVIVWVVPEVVQPPHAKPMIIAMTAPQIKPQTPNLIFVVVSGFIATGPPQPGLSIRHVDGGASGNPGAWVTVLPG